MKDNSDTQLDSECAFLVARTAMEAAESMPTSQRIMIYQGIMKLLPKDTPLWAVAQETADALLTFKKNQLKLSQLLES